MNKITIMTLVLGLLYGVTVVSAQETVVQDPVPAEEPGKWKKAGEEIAEAADAVGDATVDSSKKAWKTTKDGSVKAWDATKKGSAEALDATKEKSHELWEEGKEKFHEVTAPEPVAQPEN